MLLTRSAQSYQHTINVHMNITVMLDGISLPALQWSCTVAISTNSQTPGTVKSREALLADSLVRVYISDVCMKKPTMWIRTHEPFVYRCWHTIILIYRATIELNFQDCSLGIVAYRRKVTRLHRLTVHFLPSSCVCSNSNSMGNASKFVGKLLITLKELRYTVSQILGACS